MLTLDKARVGIVGLGYVGLPLAIEFGKIMPTVGFDISRNRIAELRSGEDRTLEVDAQELAEAVQLSYSHEADDLRTHAKRGACCCARQLRLSQVKHVWPALRKREAEDRRVASLRRCSSR